MKFHKASKEGKNIVNYGEHCGTHQNNNNKTGKQDINTTTDQYYIAKTN